MKYLLDTHTFLWAIMDTKKLSPKVHDIIRSGSNDIFVNGTTFWEIAIKVQLGKMQFTNFHLLHLPNLAQQYDFTVFSPTPYDYVTYGELPSVPGHKDPFDRMLIHSAITQNMTLLSCDTWFKEYGQYGLVLEW